MNLAGKKHNTKSEDSTERGYDVVEFVIAYICDEDQTGRYEYPDEGWRLVVCGRDTPPLFLAWMFGYACR